MFDYLTALTVMVGLIETDCESSGSKRRAVILTELPPGVQSTRQRLFSLAVMRLVAKYTG